jgi:glycosyltransferase involved in cell wall biosynthesis
VLEHERDGLIVADGDVRGFADAIVRVIRDPALGRSLGRAATAKVIAGHSWSAVANQVDAVYARVVESTQ